MKQSILALCLGALVVSCSRDDNGTDSGNTGTTETAILPVKLSYDSGETETLTYNGNKIAKIEYKATDGYYAVATYTYEGNNIVSKKEASYDKDGKIENTETTTYSYFNDKLSKVVYVYNYADGSTYQTSTSTFEYPSSTEIKETRTTTYSTSQTPRYETSTYTLNAEGIIVKRVSTYTSDSSTSSRTYTYTYDNKNGIAKNILGLDKIGFTEGNFSTKYNVLNDGYYTYEYEYNSNNYPIKSKSTNQNGDVDIYTIEYNK
ncbi:MAG: hypothetical protein Q4C75_01140 [Bergeyella zoohelcum]|nr:hypothetical protein [Bergeyella zoohelcum]